MVECKTKNIDCGAIMFRYLQIVVQDNAHIAYCMKYVNFIYNF